MTERNRPQSEEGSQHQARSLSMDAAAERPADDPRLAPSDLCGWLYIGFSMGLASCALILSLGTNIWLWAVGQLLLAISFLQWFALLHEAGHKTLFRTRWLNAWAGHLAGFLSLIPADCWRVVHARHHYWTGWQDLDMTTVTLTPRRLRALEALVINTCWRLWIPLFASIYRWNNYWNLPRLWALFPDRRRRWLLSVNTFSYLAAYGLLVWAVGWQTMLRCFGLGLLVSFALQDLLILSQHTHIPMTLSGGLKVKPYTPLEQGPFTRSLEFPRWFSQLILLNLDSHGLHHMHPRIPGYRLHRLERPTANTIRWWRWILRAKSVRGDVLLFQNRDQTGFDF